MITRAEYPYRVHAVDAEHKTVLMSPSFHCDCFELAEKFAVTLCESNWPATEVYIELADGDTGDLWATERRYICDDYRFS